MTTVYAVSYLLGGYAHDDNDSAEVSGIYTDKERARIHAMIVHGQVIQLELDNMPKGIEETAKELGLIE